MLIFIPIGILMLPVTLTVLVGRLVGMAIVAVVNARRDNGCHDSERGVGR